MWELFWECNLDEDTVNWAPFSVSPWVQGACFIQKLTPGRERTPRSMWLVRGEESWTVPDKTLIPRWLQEITRWPSFRDVLRLHRTLAETSLRWHLRLLSIPTSSSDWREVLPPPPNLHSSCFINFNYWREEWPFANITHSLELDQPTLEAWLLLDLGCRHAMLWEQTRATQREGAVPWI